MNLPHALSGRRTHASLARLVTAASSLALVLLAPALAFAAGNEGPSTDLFTRSLRTYGFAAALPSAFLVGLATAATPCVYPMIAITISVFGARKEGRGRAAMLSTAFVLGIAAMFVPLGLVAGLSGSVAGAMAGKPAVVLFEAALMFAMAASMFGVFEISLPGSVQNRLASMGGTGLGGAFLVGLAMGPIAAPCATAGLVGILDFIFQTKNAGVGALALFAYSVGLGLPFWLVGTFAVSLPKPGGWMNHVKNVLGLVLVIVGFYYLRRLVPFLREPPTRVPGAPYAYVALGLLGVALGAVHLSLKEGTGPERVRKVLGLAMAALGGVWFVSHEPAVAGARGASACTAITWERNPDTALERARSQHRPVVLDFGATWCPACEELAHITFRAQDVACAANELGFVTVKIYEDEQRPPNFDALYQQYGVRALPTVIVLDGGGHEVARETRFVPAEQMVRLLRRAEQQHSAR